MASVYIFFEILVDFTSPLEVSIVEGEVDTVEFCFTVTDLNDPYILRYILIQSLPGSARGECRRGFLCAWKCSD